MAQTRPSRSAQNVALVRAHLTRLGVVRDPYAHRMLAPDRRAWHLAATKLAGGLSDATTTSFVSTGTNE